MLSNKLHNVKKKDLKLISYLQFVFYVYMSEKDVEMI